MRLRRTINFIIRRFPVLQELSASASMRFPFLSDRHSVSVEQLQAGSAPKANHKHDEPPFRGPTVQISIQQGCPVHCRQAPISLSALLA